MGEQVRAAGRWWGREGLVHVWFRAHPLMFDALVALFWFGLAVTFVALAQMQGQYGDQNLIPVMAPWMALGATPILLRRRWFRTAVGLQVVIYALPIVAHDAYWAHGGWTLYVLTYTAAADHGWRVALPSVGILWGSATAATWAMPDAYLGDGSGSRQSALGTAFAVTYVLAITALFLGRTVHNRRTVVDALRTRARIAEENQAALASQAVLDERRRIARELHDVVAHHVSVMGVMATGARRVLANDPRRADEALETIEDTGRTALRELRRLLDVLRSSDDDPEMTPQPGLASVQTLVDQVRDAGLPVRLLVEGTERPLDPGVALSVYRIVQEALTNTLKHGGRARAEVRIKFAPDQLSVEIFDDGRGPRVAPPKPGDRVGHGLVGMRERISLYGGTLRTGPRPGGGFRVYAKIPVDTPAVERTDTT